MYRIYINDRNGASWRIIDAKTTQEISLDISPPKKRLFNNDMIDENGDLVFSYIRSCPTLAGILVLENQKTYGRTENKKRLLYNCIPDDKRLPAFLVPYDLKLGFSKNIKNKYVVFKFDNWTDDHPRGMLIETIGDIDKLEFFYEYKLYCRNLNETQKEFSKKTHKIFTKTGPEEYIQQILKNPNFDIYDHKDPYVFTIDPKNSTDFDDGFSISQTENNTTLVTVYIANVVFWLETFQLWSAFHKRVSTIYLPDRRRPMLPTILSDNLCSLTENQSRFAFCIDIEINTGGNIVNTTFYNSLVRVRKNFVYEEPALLKNTHYKNLLDISRILDPTIENSHNLVTFWMIFVNKTCGEKLCEKRAGIFRSVTTKQSVDKTSISKINADDTIHKDTKQFLKNWISIYGQYVVFSEDTQELEHSFLETHSYTHITSPIRRLVDLLNHMIFFTQMGLVKSLSPDAENFLQNWLTDIDVINEKMKSTAKVERECEIMRKCLTNPRLLEESQEAYVVGIRDTKYTLFLEREKIILNTTKTDTDENPRELYKKYRVRLYKIDSYGVASKIKVAWESNI